MKTIGNADFYSTDLEQVRRCQEALELGRTVSETYDTLSGERHVTGLVRSVREESGQKWRISIKPTSDAR